VPDWVPCSQMPLPGTVVAAVPFVRVVERVGTAAVEVGELVLRQIGLDEYTPSGVRWSPSEYLSVPSLTYRHVESVT